MAEVRRVGAVGSGYVGRVTGACLSHLGNRVMGVDKDEDKDKDKAKDKDDDDTSPVRDSTNFSGYRVLRDRSA